MIYKKTHIKKTYKNIDLLRRFRKKSKNETSEETLNRYLNDEFYKDILKHIKKRPIYWMFSSGKEKGFKV